MSSESPKPIDKETKDEKLSSCCGWLRCWGWESLEGQWLDGAEYTKPWRGASLILIWKPRRATGWGAWGRWRRVSGRGVDLWGTAGDGPSPKSPPMVSWAVEVLEKLRKCGIQRGVRSRVEVRNYRRIYRVLTPTPADACQRKPIV